MTVRSTLIPHYVNIYNSHNTRSHELTCGFSRSIGENNTSNKLNSHMVSTELEPVARTFGTTVVKDDALAACATHATQRQDLFR
jgi:hypothetical protein